MRAYILASSLILLPFVARAEDPAPISYICVEAESGQVIDEAFADLRRPPASMVKLMLMLVVCEGLDNGTWQPGTPITVSARAQFMGGSQVYLEKGQTWPLDHLMHAVAIGSANDAALAVAEGLFGTVEAYVQVMNKRAQELGMVDSVFHSPHGLPPDKGQEPDLTTARDMALLAREAAKHPRIFAWTSVREFEFKPGQAMLYNTNKLLWRMEECDGLKTGYINAAGYCLTATATRDGLRVITVIMGADSFNGRFQLAQQLLEHGLASLKHATLLRAGDPIGEPQAIPFAAGGPVELSAAGPLTLLSTTEDIPRIELAITIDTRLLPPIAAHTVIGEVYAELDGRRLATAPVMVSERVALDMWALLTGQAAAR